MLFGILVSPLDPKLLDLSSQRSAQDPVVSWGHGLRTADAHVTGQSLSLPVCFQMLWADTQGSSTYNVVHVGTLSHCHMWRAFFCGSLSSMNVCAGEWGSVHHQGFGCPSCAFLGRRQAGLRPLLRAVSHLAASCWCSCSECWVVCVWTVCAP